MRASISLLLLSACATPAIQWGWAPAELLVPPSQAEYLEKPAVYLLKQRTIVLVSRWREDSYTQWHQHNVIAILNEKGFSYANVRVPYSAKGKFVRFEARTVNADGTIAEVAASRVYDDELTKSEKEEGNDYKARVFSFPEVKVGSILEYQYILEVPSFYTSIHEYLNDQLPVKRYRLSIIGTDDTAYKIKAYNTAVPFQTDKSGEHWTISWSLDDVAASNDEPFRLGRPFLDPWVIFVVTKRSKYSYSHDYYTDWNHGLKWKGDELYYDNDEYYEGFDPKVDVAGCTDKICRIDRAVKYLAESYPFRGWHSYPGRNAKEATDAKRASGVEKSRLLWRILEKQGIEAKFAFVDRYLTAYTDRDLASYWPGNHLIVRVEKQEGVPEPIWVDASCEYCAVGELPVWLKDAEAMVIHASKPPPSLRVEAKAELAKVTGKANHLEGHLVDLRLSIQDRASATVDSRFETYGRDCMNARRKSLDKPADVRKKEAENMVKERYAGGQVLAFEPLKVENGTCTRKIRFSASGYANLDEGRLLVPLTLFRSKWDRWLKGDDERTLQVALREAWQTTEVLRVEAPAGFEPIRLPPVRTAQAKGIAVTIAAERRGDAVEIERSIRFHPGLYDKKNYPDMEKALETFSSLRQDVIEFGPKASPPITSSEPGGTPRK